MRTPLTLAAALLLLSAATTACSNGAKQPAEPVNITDAPGDTTSPYDTTPGIDAATPTATDSAQADTARQQRLRDAALRVKEQADKQNAEAQALKDKLESEGKKQQAETDKAIRNAQQAVRNAQTQAARETAAPAAADSTR